MLALCPLRNPYPHKNQKPGWFFPQHLLCFTVRNPLPPLHVFPLLPPFGGSHPLVRFSDPPPPFPHSGVVPPAHLPAIRKHFTGLLWHHPLLSPDPRHRVVLFLFETLKPLANPAPAQLSSTIRLCAVFLTPFPLLASLAAGVFRGPILHCVFDDS